jgi:hypothetical protein
MNHNEERSHGALVYRCNALEAEVERLTQRLRAQDEQQEMWTCSICDCTIRKEQMELGDGTPAPCPECGRIAAEMEVARLRNAVRLVIAHHAGVVWTTVRDADVDGYVEAAEAAARGEEEA